VTKQAAVVDGVTTRAQKGQVEDRQGHIQELSYQEAKRRMAEAIRGNAIPVAELETQDLLD